MNNTSENNIDFRIIQYEALRSEVISIKERLIRLQIFGLTGIPFIMSAGKQFDLIAVLVVTPIITFSFLLTIIFEQGSLMRIGEYIRTILEREFDVSYICWEAWLQQERHRRNPTRFYSYSIYCIFSVYFIFSGYLSFGTLKINYNMKVAIVCIILYILLFIFSMYTIKKHFRVDSSEKESDPIDMLDKHNINAENQAR